MNWQELKGFKFNKRILVIVLAAAVATAAFGGGLYKLGYDEGLRQTKNIVVEGVANINPPEGLTIAADFSTFWEAWNTLKEYHPSIGDIDDQDLIYGAIAGLTDAIGDVNTAFFNPDDAKQFSETINGHFSGIGTEIAIKDNQLVVVAPLAGSPAEGAGLRAGDKILAIDDESTDGIRLEDAVSKIRGDAGTTVTLTISRPSFDAPRDFEITRGDIEIPSLQIEMDTPGIIYIQINSFSGNVPFLFYTAVAKGEIRNAQGVILDLRNNPGGFLEVAVETAGWFMDKNKLVAIEKFSSGEQDEFRTYTSSPLQDLPIVVLVNGGSASASEILAGALRVNRGVKLVGEQTFGKGTVQQLYDLADDSTLKITVANWLLPDGTLIDGNGLTPDVVIDQGEDDLLNGEDTQLLKALEILKAEIK